MENKFLRPYESLTDAFKRGHGHGHGPRSWSRSGTYLVMGDCACTLNWRTRSYLTVLCVVRPMTLLAPTRVSASGSRAGAGRDRPSAQCAMQHDFTPHASRSSLCTYCLEMMMLLHAMRYGSLGVASIMLMSWHAVDQRGPSARASATSAETPDHTVYIVLGAVDSDHHRHFDSCSYLSIPPGSQNSCPPPLVLCVRG